MAKAFEEQRQQPAAAEAEPQRSLRQSRPAEQGFRSCLGILSLMKSYGPERIEAAARRGNDIGATTYGSIK